MTRTFIVIIVSIVGIAASADAVTGAPGQPPVCLHAAGETPADAARRQDAIRVMRAITTAQTQAFAANGAYRNFRELTASGLPPRPAGFQTQLTVEGSTYALLLRDTVDPCRYTLFSDQDGLIYLGSPLQ